MSLSRAFTSRRAKGSIDMGDNVKRSHTLNKGSTQQHLRHKISAPMELIHTTNMLSYNAPDIHPQRPTRNNITTTKVLEDESDSLTTPGSTPPTSPESDPFEQCAPQSNHLSTYFMAPPSVDNAPAIPKRSPSHTKQNSFDALARKRSTSRLSRDSHSSNPSLSFSRSSSTSTRASSTSRASALNSKQNSPVVPHPLVTSKPTAISPIAHYKPVSNPFGQELPQVTEIAEDLAFNGRLEVIHEDEIYLTTRGLAKMTADDYLNEIHSVMTTFWPERSELPSSGPLWI